ncbi:MAG: NAD-dependent epimerase/dehydratase family protein [Candidatus Brocadiaceae bacterium]|nr:NAD-dependent epimerase/dehydratase family protein [Candidatus Brocadiaceae bacterium]
MKVLITGGAGFIGSHLAEKYLECGDDVYIIDDLSTGTLENIKHLQGNANHKDKLFVTIDSILNHDVMLELVGICDVVLHMAAAVGVQYILENPLSSIITNIKGTEEVLELCNKFRKKVLIASTSEVYGKHTHAPLVETDNIIYGPSTKFRWSYAAAKLMDEFTALAYHRTKKLPVIIIRLFNTVGPRQTGRYGMVVPRLVQQALRNEAITVYGDGTQTRVFTFVEDVVDAITKLIECSDAIGDVTNIGGAEEITIGNLAEMVKKLTCSNSEIKHIPYAEVYTQDFEDMQRRVPSIEKVEKLINWKPTTSLENILEEVVNYYRVNEQ